VDAEGVPEVVVGVGWTEATAGRSAAQLPPGPVAEVVASRTPMILPSIRHDPRFAAAAAQHWKPDTEVAFLCVPIEDHGEVIGTLSVERERHRPVRLEEEVRLLTMIANLVGQAVRLQRLITRDRERLIEEQARLGKLLVRSGVVPPPEDVGIVGDSPAIRGVLDKLRMVARSNTTVLLRGESGTGKELFAQALHRLSPRKDEPFIAVNCAALPESVLESELFGHEKGAFTNAGALRRGRFELADGGTLFLDEIGEVPLEMQVKLLRVLQESEFERVGGIKTTRVDVRVVAATNRDLAHEIEAGRFRKDLYYRLNVVPIHLAPLRDRTSDIPALVKHFIDKYNRRLNKKVEGISEEALVMLQAYPWPGNIRELENLMERVILFVEGARIEQKDLPGPVRGGGAVAAVPPGVTPKPGETPLKDFLKQRQAEIEKSFIVQALQKTEGNVTRAAKLLQISRKSLQTKMKEFGLRDESPPTED